MKKKTLLQSVIPLIVLAVTAFFISFSFILVNATAQPTFNVNGTAYSGILPKNYLLTYAEENKATLNGTDYELSTLTTYPSGKTSKGTSVLLSELGDYSVKYYFNDGNAEYFVEENFSVDNTIESLFSNSENCEITGDASVPDYILNANEGLSGYWGSQKGVNFKVNSQDAVIRFDGVISVDDIDCETDFIEMLIAPKEYDEQNGHGVLEFANTKIIVKLIDAVNQDVGIEYVMQSSNEYTISTFVRTLNGKEQLGYKNWLDSYGYGDSYIHSSYYGYYKNAHRVEVTHSTQPSEQAYKHEASSIKLFYDSNKNASYGLPSFTDYIGDEQYEITDFSTDPAFQKYVSAGWLKAYNKVDKGGEGIWDWDDTRSTNFKGFPSGAVKLEISFEGLGKGSGNLMIFSVGGKKLTDWNKTTYQTKISVDTGFSSEDELPSIIASPNATYPVFDAIGYNFIEGLLKKPSVKVYYEDSSNQLPIRNNSFPVTKAGAYYIEYKVYPNAKYGSVTTKTIVINAKNVYDFIIDYTINPLTKNTVLLGDKVNLYEGEFVIPESQAKFFTFHTNVYLNGKPVKVEQGKFCDYFIAENTGDYYINYSYTDYAGDQYIIKIVKVTSQNPDEPVFDDLILPKALIQGSKYEFPMPTVTNNASISVKVGSVDYTKKEFVVPSEDFVVTYTATANGLSSTISKTIKVLENKRYLVVNNNKNVNPFQADYFIAPNGYSLESYSSNSLPFYTETSNELVSFINVIDLNFFKFNFYFSQINTNNSGLKIVLTDSVNELQKVVLKFVKEGETIKLYNNEILLATINGSFNVNSEQFALNMKDEFGDLYNATEKIATIKEFANGLAFSGFESGKVFLEFGFEGVTGASTINITNLAGQPMNCSHDRDRGDPNLFFKNDLPSYKVCGLDDEVVIILPKAYDVLSVIKENKATITMPNGTEITLDEDNDTFVLDFDKYGYGEYLVEYYASDYSDRVNDSLFNKFVVKDFSEPVITLSNELPKYVSVGDTLKLPSATANDLIGSYVTVTVSCMYNHSFVKLGANNTINFTKAGKYIIYYYAVGESGNVSFLEFTVEAI